MYDKKLITQWIRNGSFYPNGDGKNWLVENKLSYTASLNKFHIKVSVIKEKWTRKKYRKTFS